MRVGIFILSVLVLFVGHIIGQDKKIDKLEMLYDQGNYKIVLRKSEKLMRNDAYKKHPAPVVFHALAEYQESKTNEKFSASNAIYDYEKFLALDSLFYYQKAYANYIYDMRMGIADDIRKLNETGQKDKAKIKYDTYNRLFGNVANFDELTATGPKPDNSSNANLDVSEVRKNIVKEAKKHIGVPYKYGGITTSGFDCSGFTQYVFNKNGTLLPRTAGTQAESYEQIKLTKVQPGDLVFFGSNKNNISHVGIVISIGGKEPLAMIHASSSRGIMITNVDNDNYWSPKLQFAVTVLK